MNTYSTKCGNCGALRGVADLDYIADFWARCEPGETIPAGQCPEPDCGAFCYPVEAVAANWENDAIQFPRLLAEIVATQEIDFAVLSESTGLELARIDELFDRAQRAWEKIKAGLKT